MKKYYLPIGILIFSITITAGSFFAFNAYSKAKAKVKKASTRMLEEMPLNSTLVSQDTNLDNKTLSFITILSQDQILEFYNKYAMLNDWQKVNEQTYKNKEGTVTINIDAESNGRNLVTVKEVF